MVLSLFIIGTFILEALEGFVVRHNHNEKLQAS